MDFRLSNPALISSVVLSLPRRTKDVDPMDRLTLILRLLGVSLPAGQAVCSEKADLMSVNLDTEDLLHKL